MVTDVTTKPLSRFFSLFETSLIHRIMEHRLLLVFAATKLGKIGSCAQTAAGLRSRQGACFQTRPWKCKDARSGTLSWVWPRLSLRPWRWVEARAGESLVFVCLPWWSTLRLSSVISGLMNGPGYVMGGSGATSSQLKETDEGPSANQLKKKKKNNSNLNIWLQNVFLCATWLQGRKWVSRSAALVQVEISLSLYIQAGLQWNFRLEWQSWCPEDKSQPSL